MKAIDIGSKLLRNSLLVSFVGFTISGCVVLPPSDLPLSELPVVSEKGCVITVIRARTFGFSGMQQYISFDGVNVARIHGGEYTRFLVPEGRHTIGITWQFWGFAGCGVRTCAGVAPKDFNRQVEMECHAGENFSYGITKDGWMDDNRFKIKQVTDIEDEFRLDGKTLVPARTSK
jgi:hypothetical protein